MNEPLTRLGRALETADAVAAVAAMTADVTLRVAVHEAPFEGRQAAAQILGAVLDGALHGIEVIDTIGGDGNDSAAVLMFTTGVAAYPVRAEGLLVARTDENGGISDLTVFLRPLAALQALSEEMGRRLGGPRPDGIA